MEDRRSHICALDWGVERGRGLEQALPEMPGASTGEVVPTLRSVGRMRQTRQRVKRDKRHTCKPYWRSISARSSCLRLASLAAAAL